MPVIPDVPAFKLEYASGNMAFLAAQAALSAVGKGHSLAYLAGASGDAFKFVYDGAPVREPLRDLRPADSLARAFAACGLRAEWIPDATLDHVRGQVEAHAEIGQPILTAFLPGEDYHGCFLLVGYDEDSDILYYQRAYESPSQDMPYRTLKLDAATDWDGPVTGPPHWLSFPMLVIRGPLYDPPDAAALRQAALQGALDALQGDPIPYPTHPGAGQYARVPLEGRAALQGLAALAQVAADLREADLRDFATIWRLDAQLMQLAWDRELAALYLESREGDGPPALIARYRTIAHTARTLGTRNWERRSMAMNRPAELRAFIEGTAAYLYALPEDDRLRDAVRDLGTPIQTVWGSALLVATAERREGAARLAERLHDLEAACAPLLEQALTKL